MKYEQVDTQIVDYVDETNTIIGSTQRKNLLTEGLNFRVVHLLLFDVDNNLILQQLISDHPRSPGLLGSSAAGYVMSGESEEEAIKRVTERELDAHVGDYNKMSEVTMRDESSLKFISIFSARIDTNVSSGDPYTHSLMKIGPHDLQEKLLRSPEIFTKTSIEILKEIVL